MNIFVVEDEPPILREIIAVIQSFHEDYQVIGKAQNGQEAVEFLQEKGKQVDVMITDIHVPVKNGLELIAYANRHFSHILSMILTGFGTFDYARQAMQEGVFCYLLKPIDEEELRKELQKAYAQKCMDYMQRQPDTAARGEEAGWEAGCQVALLSLGFYPADTYGCDELIPDTWKRFGIEGLFEQYEGLSERFWVIDGMQTSEKIILFLPPEQARNDSGKLLAQILSPLLKSGTGITIGIDTRVGGVRHIRQSVLELRSFVNHCARLEKAQLLFGGQEPGSYAGAGQEKEFRSFGRRLAELFAARSMPVFQAELKNYLNMMKNRELPTVQVYQLLQELLRACLQASDLPATAPESFVIGEVLMFSDSYASLYENIYSIFLSHFESMVKKERILQNKSSVLLRIDAYIRENYTRQINTQSVAEHFGFTPAYLSQIFREYKKVTPANYITSLRVEKAKKLFAANPECKIKDVAVFVGYEDSLYFSKVFKRTTGMSPKQFLEHR